MDWPQIVTLVIAVIGTVLGIINIYDLLNKNRLRVKVVPSPTFPVDPSSEQKTFVCIEVINMSNFPISIREVGFSLPDSKKLIILEPLISDGKSLPHRLESRESISVFCQLAQLDPNILCHAKKAYAITSCGNKIEGTSPALKQLIQIAKEIR